MFCTQCGNEVQQHARFCSKCGHEISTTLAPVSQGPPKKAPPDMAMHINILGWLLVGSSILTAFGGLLLLFAGQVIRYLPVSMADGVPVGVPHFVGWLTGMLGFGALGLGAAGAAAGIGLLEYQNWARVLAIIVAVMLLFHFPIGTIIGAYAFWVLFSQEGQAHYKARSAATIA
jgi:hypothetical protein